MDTVTQMRVYGMVLSGCIVYLDLLVGAPSWLVSMYRHV